MTIIDLLDQVEIQGRIRVQEVTDIGILVRYIGFVEHLANYAKDHEEFVNKEITYIFPDYVDGRNGICIEIK